ncbi:MAG TPA: hypothetical protein VHL77_01580, partial [Ferruginibacter sp.]|nr:hypothetical protein [Ferruginibacter sp.]
MKKIFFVLGIVVMAMTGYRCNNKVVPADGVMKGRLVVKEICSHFVVEVLNAKLDTSIVSNGWHDDKRDKIYDQVFTVSNRCGFAAANLKEGDEFEFTFDKEPPAENCAVCMAFYPTPVKRNAIRISKHDK